MKILIKGGRVIDPANKIDETLDILVSSGRILEVGKKINEPKAKVVDGKGKIVAKADITIDRSEYDVKYGSGSFFDDLGDETIYDEFTLKVELVATEKKH